MPEQRVVLRNCGVTDPSDIESYLGMDGFRALLTAREKMTPAGVVEEVKKSGLRGRGGAGFPTGLKWDLASKSPGAEKYVICNADEGEVGTFKDRHMLQEDPFGLIEGIAIAAHAIGAQRAYLYLREEYHYLLNHFNEALEQARSKGFLGSDCDVEVREGAGAYVCGEESALIESVEGKRGEARFRPPFPPNHGLWQEPTIVNNVETLMNIPAIIRNGADWFNSMGTEQSKGTKVFSVAGDVDRAGIYELPMGTPLRELVETLAGGKYIKAVQVGGASGRVIPAAKLDITLAFESACVGAGAVMVFNDTRSAIELARQNFEFFAEESCGKCVPCREGTRVMLHLLSRIARGDGKKKDLGILKELSETMMLASLCGLGQAAPNSVVDTLEYFDSEYQESIAD